LLILFHLLATATVELFMREFLLLVTT